MDLRTKFSIVLMVGVLLVFVLYCYAPPQMNVLNVFASGKGFVTDNTVDENLSNSDTAESNTLRNQVTQPEIVKPTKFTIMDWNPLYLSLENGLPENYKTGNCLVTRDKRYLNKSHAVVIEVRRVPYLNTLPKERAPWQRWLYFNVESPYFAILDYKGRYKMEDFTGKIAFNWSMTYRRDSHAPVSYGWRIKRDKPINITNVFKGKQKLVAAMMSNCKYVRNSRMKYIKELQKHTTVDFYGKCGNLKCEGHYKAHSCPKIKNYKFFLTFENSNCRDYISEKMWMQAFDSYAVPVVMGAYKEDYVKVAPPNSFIHVDDFDSPKSLAQYLTVVGKNESAYNTFHAWRKEWTYQYDFRMLSKKGYVWRSVCNALNKRWNEKPSWYNRITDFESEKDCYQNAWIKKN